MEYTAEKVEQARNNIVEAEQRILRQRRRVEKMLIERNPADEAQAQLLIMEQSLISMTRFLGSLERKLAVQDLQRHPSAKRSKAAPAEPASAAAGGDVALANAGADQ